MAVTWDAPVLRVEAGGGYHIRRNLLVKARVPAQPPRRRPHALPATWSPASCSSGSDDARAGGRSLAAVLAAAAAAGAPDEPRRGTIRGRVEVRRETPRRRATGRPSATVGMPPHHGRPDRRRSVVYLETAPRGAFELREGARAVMDQRDETFVPHVLAITAGTTVDFPNSDRTYHNVFSLSKANRFDLGRYGRGPLASRCASTARASCACSATSIPT